MAMKYRILPQEFYSRDTAIVARELLGKIFCRKINNLILAGKIVETEAYLGKNDPAAIGLRKTKNIPQPLLNPPGHVFVYFTYGNHWMLNIIAKIEQLGAVLIRAVEPWREIDEMFKHRRATNKKINKVEQLCSGPGKFTQGFKIDKSLQNTDVTKLGDIFVLDNSESFKIESSHRIGVSRDLRKKLRFYIKGNKFVSNAR
jgi:DNA-3-methyladenine glycosylase